MVDAAHDALGRGARRPGAPGQRAESRTRRGGARGGARGAAIPRRGSGKGAVWARLALAGLKGAEPNSCRGTARAGRWASGKTRSWGLFVGGAGGGREPSPPLSLPSLFL